MVGVTVATPTTAVNRPSFLSTLRPLNSGPGEIRALDGLRAIAALSVMLFHSYYVVSPSVIIGGVDTTYLWYYGQTGVHLFFILSGFLLFTPYARAILEGHPLPSAKRFFQRRALRILPAYWVCLAILSVLHFRKLSNPTGLVNIGMHILMIHDDVYPFSRSINGPFWTLAIEAQFYLVLPLFAWVIAKFVGGTRSRLRLAVGVVGIMLGALALRAVDATVHGRYFDRSGLTAEVANLFVHATLGAQGKYLEVFALGMLCSVAYLATKDESRRLRRRLPWLAIALVAGALVAYVPLAQLATRVYFFAPPFVLFYHAFDFMVICGPLLTGLPYAALTIGALWGPRWLRSIFEFRPLRFIGLISYSLYLWHLPVLHFVSHFTTGLAPMTRIGIEILAGFLLAVPVAYLSYQIVERPFLSQRRRLTVQAA